MASVKKHQIAGLYGQTRSAIYPREKWIKIPPHDAGFDPAKLNLAKDWLDKRVGDGRYRVVIIRSGRLVANWNYGFGHNKNLYLISRIAGMIGRTSSATARLRDIKLPLASVAKAIFSCILGIAIVEGKLPSADAKVFDYYPEAMDVPEGEGPKAERYAFEKDRDITFRQLISNTSGYMKPGEEPGKTFHYQTYGMNILTHAIARIYGLYSITDPVGSPGFKQLVDEKLRIPIGANWVYFLMNFNLHPKARIHIFGNCVGIKASALDMARLGWLWCNQGRWLNRQIVPESWLREATQTAPDIRASCSRKLWKYGYGFWTNDELQLWPSLPRDSFAASGAGSQHIWVCPSLELVVVQSPGLWNDQTENDTDLLRHVVNACE